MLLLLPARLSAIALSVFFAVPAVALDLPPHKPGLWEMKLVQGGGRHASELALQRCTDASTDQFVTALVGGLAAEACSKQDVRTVGDKIVIDSVCKAGTASTNAHAEITGSFESGYTLTVSTREASQSRATPRQIVVDSKWLGPCTARQKPGDIILPGGIKMNVRNINGILGLLGGLQ